MPRRSTRIKLSNNTPFTLTLIGASGPCHGSWTDLWQPPQEIQPRTQGAWESESSGIGTGTQGWVKYLIENTDYDSNSTNAPQSLCRQELAYIQWDNPFVWANDTQPIFFSVSTSDVTPPCDADKGVWDFPGSGLSSRNCRHELFGAEIIGAQQGGITWWDAVMSWPVLLVFTVTGDMDVNLEFTVVLRQLGSVDETIFSFYDGSKGLRSLARTAGQSSLKKLFHM